MLKKAVNPVRNIICFDMKNKISNGVKIIILGLLLCLILYIVKTYKENQSLRRIIERLSAESRIAEVLVTDVKFDPKTNKTYTTIKFIEYDTKLKPQEPKYFSFSGNIIQFQSMVIRFDDFYIKKGHPLKGKSAYLFMKVFTLTDKGAEVFEINKINQIPSGYEVKGAKNNFERRLWRRFWQYALDPKEAKRVGVKNAQIEAPGTKFIPGYIYTIKIEHDGGMRIDSQPLSAILKDLLKISKDEETFLYLTDEIVSYRVRFNGIDVGRIEFQYQGCKEIDKIYQHIIVIRSNVRILKLFQIESEEKIYVDKDKYLPLKVKREVKFLGKRESILEEYNQKEGKVEVIKKGTPEGRLLQQNPPIHNIVSLVFLYPLDFQNNLGKTLEFNLPLERISLKIKELKKVATSKSPQEFYILEGSPRKFLVLFKKDKRLPFRLEFPAFLGKVTISLDKKEG